MKIGLFGFSFEDRNKGCEALTYSFIGILEKLIPNELQIVNLSGIGHTEKVVKRFPNIIFSCVGFQKNKISLRSFKELMSCDVVFDCTFGDNFSDIYSFSFVSRTTNYKEMTLLFHKRLVIAPQTIGPFKNEKLKKRVGKVLQKADLVFTRDQTSSIYCKELSGIEPITVSDLAFGLPYEKPENVDPSIQSVGINVSGLLWRGGFDNNNQFGLNVDYRTYIQRVVKWCKDKGYRIHFIPHVLSNDLSEIDEDYKVCAELANQFGERCADFFEDPIEAKNYISRMDFFIGARMHSTIAAFSVGVVTIPFSYSRKFEGLYESVNYHYTINGKLLTTDEAVKRTINYIENSQELREAQRRSMSVVEKLERHFEDTLKQYIASI